MSASDATEANFEQPQQSPPGGEVSIAVRADSPFPDGYDIASERDALADLLAAANPDESDPRWSRLVLLCEREAQLRQLQSIHKPLREAQSIAPKHLTRGVMAPVRLVDEEPATMVIHTREAFGVFTGWRPEAQRNRENVGGGQRFAAVLKSIWVLSGSDNPYADWLLITMYDRLSELRLKIEAATNDKQALIDRLKTRGLSFAVMKSRNPKIVELGFRSPYGYATAGVIVVFDYYVRLVKTLVRKDQISDEEGMSAIWEAGRALRALFIAPILWERFLRRHDMKALCRADFLPTADEASRKRVKAAVDKLGEVPPSIFAGTLVPRHSLRRGKRAESTWPSIEQNSLHAGARDDVDETELL